MKTILIIGIVLVAALIVILKTPKINKHRIETIKFVSESLKGNTAGENPLREVSIYLPPDYQQSNKRYPVLYYLHGFGGSHLDYEFLDIDHIMDSAIKKGLEPFIIVVPNSHNTFNGGYYYNSPTNGMWSDYIAKDVVDYIDKHYRTISNKEHRAIAGHSMGGQGALRIAMLYPELFNSVYAMSPSILYWGDDFKPEHSAFKVALEAESMEELHNNSYAMAFAGMGRVFTPNPNKQPFCINLPIHKVDGKIEIDSGVYKTWDGIFLYQLVVEQQNALKQIKHLSIEWGNRDEYAHIPSSCQLFCQRLDSLGISYQKDIYNGGHIDQLTGKNGRFAQKLLPFVANSFRK